MAASHSYPPDAPGLIPPSPPQTPPPRANTTGSNLRFSPTESLDDPVNLPRAERDRPLEPGLVSNPFKPLRLRGGEAYKVPNAQEHRLRRAPLGDDQRSASVCHLP
jgi:hypothetical protein